MPFTGRQVIDGARGLDQSFSPQNHPGRVCLEFLTRYQRRLAAKMLQREKDSISSEITISLPLADFPNGVALESAPGVALQYDMIQDLYLLDDEDRSWPLPLVPFKGRMTADRTLFCWIREKTLFLSGIAQDWVNYSSIRVTHAPTPGAVALDTDMILPDTAFDVCVLALGAEMGKRNPEALKRSTIAQEAMDAEEDFLNVIEERNDPEIGTVRRVFSV